MKYYAYHEKDFAGRWNVVIYHGERPPKTVNGNSRERINEFEVPAEFIGSDGEPMFGAISKYMNEKFNMNKDQSDG